MANVVIMPKQGQSVESCILTEFKKKKGEKVAVGDLLFSYETDKASFEESSKFEGTILEIFFNEGDEIPVLTNVLVIGNEGESVDEYRPGNENAAATTPAATAAVTEQAVAEVEKEIKPAVSFAPERGISPRAKALAAKFGVNVALVAGSGPHGRVIEQDIKDALASGNKLTPLAQAMMSDKGLQSPASGSGLAGTVKGVDLGKSAAAAAVTDDSTVKPLTNIRKLIGKAMYASLQNSAQLTHHLSADARRIMELRKQIKKKMDAGELTTNITLNDLVCLAVIKALKKFPNVNTHFLGDSIRYFNKVHLACAVDTERGLMVPVIRNADDLTIVQLAQQLKKLADDCKKGCINPDLLSSEAATFTVSNLGNYGVEIFTPIINVPQSAILGVDTIIPRPKDLGGGVYAFVPHIGLSLTYDHRSLDGGEATRFVKQIATEIETLTIDL